MSSDSVLDVPAKGKLSDLKKPWFRCNDRIGRQVKLLNSKGQNRVLWHSICCSAPLKGWRKNTTCCKAYIEIRGPNEDNCEVVGINLHHTCVAGTATRKRNYGMKDLVEQSDALTNFQRPKKGAGVAKQFSPVQHTANL